MERQQLIRLTEKDKRIMALHPLALVRLPHPIPFCQHLRNVPFPSTIFNKSIFTHLHQSTLGGNK